MTTIGVCLKFALFSWAAVGVLWVVAVLLVGWQVYRTYRYHKYLNYLQQRKKL
jgi:uncharacterized membrane protein YukC